MIDDCLWVVMECLSDKTTGMVGVFDSELKAVEECLEFNYFLGPVELNKPFPKDFGEWPGCYFSKINEKPDDWSVVERVYNEN